MTASQHKPITRSVRISAASSYSFGWGGLVFFAMNVALCAEDMPAFRFQSAQLRPLVALPPATQGVATPLVSVPSLPPVIARPPRIRNEDQDLAAFIRRQHLRGLAGSERTDTFTIRTTDGAAVLAQLSLGLQVQIQSSDNANSAPAGQARADTIYDFTPIARVIAGGSPGLQPEDSREPEYYLDALYAPTEHRLLQAAQSAFLQHLLVEAGRSTPIVQTGVRLTYDENTFAAGTDSSAEESYALLEVGPVLKYRLSPKTTLGAHSAYRRITLDQPDGNRREGDIDAGFEYEYSPKTTLGLGFEGGHIEFDREDFGTQDYQQGYFSMAWKPTPKLMLRTRTGVERREFQRVAPKPDKISVVSSAAIEWRPSEQARLTATFANYNQPSVTQGGSLFRETRYGLDGSQDIGRSCYLRCEMEYRERAYDTMRYESEVNIRPAIGYRIVSSPLVDSARIEVFYQFRRHWNRSAAGYDRNQFGVQLTTLF